MGILRKTGQVDSVTEGSRALDLFTDRRFLTRHFLEYLNDDPPREKILFFHGDGGNGKSLLLRYLRNRCCRRLSPEEWDQLKNTRDHDVVRYMEGVQTAEAVPTALLDFRMQAPHESFAALMKMRRELGEHGLEFGLFDFAAIWYLHKTEGLTADRLRTLFPPDATDLVAGIVDALTDKPLGVLGKWVLNKLHKQWAERLTIFLQGLGLDKARVEEIRNMEPEPELLEQLPKLFAEDLSTAMTQEGAPKRVVLFFDTHEAFWGLQRSTMTGDLFFQRDEWLRCLLGTLELSAGIVAAISGRDAPRWSQASRVAIPNEYLDLHLVGNLPEADALYYLDRAGIADDEMRSAIVAYTRENPGEVHPLFLGLCADIVLAAESKGTTLTASDFPTQPDLRMKGKELVDRLLRYVDRDVREAVLALGACRSFDRDVYTVLGNALRFGVSKAQFDALTEFSFVRTEADGQSQRYRVHDLLRRLLRERGEEAIRRADETLERYYLQRADAGEEFLRGEAIYHANQLEWERGVEMWVQAFNRALSLGRYTICRELLEVRTGLEINTNYWLGWVSASEGEYFAALARFREAYQEYTEAVDVFYTELVRGGDRVCGLSSRGVALWQLGQLLVRRADYKGARWRYRLSIASFDRVLELAPDNSRVLDRRGTSLTCLGQLQMMLADHEGARESYWLAVESYNRAIDLDPEYAAAFNNKGLALNSLGELQFSLRDHKGAQDSLEAAVEAYNLAIDLDPEYVPVLINRGITLRVLGWAQFHLGNDEGARESHRLAIEAFDRALDLAPEHVKALGNMGRAFASLGKLQASLSDHEGARESYRLGIEAFDRALDLAPEDVYALSDRGSTLLNLGELQASLSDHEGARESYRLGIEFYDRALDLAPEHVETLCNKGLALVRLGNSRAKLSDNEGAQESYRLAIEACHQALAVAPQSIFALYNRGLALKSLGNLQEERTGYQGLVDSLMQALQAFESVLEIAPQHSGAIRERDEVTSLLQESREPGP